MMGFGITGRAICEFAIHHHLPIAVSENATLSQLDRHWLEDRKIQFEHGGHTTGLLADADTIVLSPGVSGDLPVLEEARYRGQAIISEIDFALRYLSDSPVIAVTGTNGKSSTVEVIAAILQSLGKRAWTAGNIGVPLIGLVDTILATDVLVLEMSSYQLEQSREFRPRVGVLLTLTPDHLQRHKTMQAYIDAKARIFANQRADDVAILPRHLATSFSQGQGHRVFYDQMFETLPDEAQVLLPHEQSNLRAALAACQALIPQLDVSQIGMSDVVRTFRLPHRMELVGAVDGVCIINDSKSTNPGSAIAALKSVVAPIVLLLGGHSKGAGYEALVDACLQSSVKQIILFGEAADELGALFARQHREADYPIAMVSSLQDAVDAGLGAANRGDVLLLSPACSSFDAFSSFVERGNAFTAQIRSKAGFTPAPSRT